MDNANDRKCPSIDTLQCGASPNSPSNRTLPDYIRHATDAEITAHREERKGGSHYLRGSFDASASGNTVRGINQRFPARMISTPRQYLIRHSDMTDIRTHVSLIIKTKGFFTHESGVKSFRRVAITFSQSENIILLLKSEYSIYFLFTFRFIESVCECR